MRFHDIEVSGIESIVFNRKNRWVFADIGDKGTVWRELDQTPGATPGFPIGGKYKTHTEMMKIVNELKKDRRYRMWIHYDTLNIVRKVNGS
jgi:hypothetical protein